MYFFRRHFFSFCMIFFTARTCRQKALSDGKQEYFIQHCQYHGCWWPGDAKSRGISSHGSDPFRLQYSSLTIRLVKSFKSFFFLLPMSIIFSVFLCTGRYICPRALGWLQLINPIYHGQSYALGPAHIQGRPPCQKLLWSNSSAYCFQTVAVIAVGTVHFSYSSHQNQSSARKRYGCLLWAQIQWDTKIQDRLLSEVKWDSWVMLLHDLM